jgi:hypothetical protein
MASVVPMNTKLTLLRQPSKVDYRTFVFSDTKRPLRHKGLGHLRANHCTAVPAGRGRRAPASEADRVQLHIRRASLSV